MRNSFIVANQWTFIENSNKRPDVIIFLNGLPVVVIELKSPSREETDASEACLFKTGFFKQLDAGLSDIASILSFGNQELSGTAELLDTAREYAIKKMIIKAADMGANAIVGIDSESSMGSGIMHITIYGTAVNVERIEPADSQ